MGNFPSTEYALIQLRNFPFGFYKFHWGHFDFYFDLMKNDFYELTLVWRNEKALVKNLHQTQRGGLVPKVLALHKLG